MTKLQRLRSLLIGIIMIAVGGLMMLDNVSGYSLVLDILTISMGFTAVGTLYYYFTMARFMVGGKSSLYRGIVLLDFAYFTSSIADLPRYYVLLYLVAIHAFSGAVEILRSNEAKRYGAKNWKLKLTHGIINVIIALSCIVFIRFQNTAVIIFGLGVIYSGIIRIITAFRRTGFVYIQ